jgi:transketolase
LLSLRLKGSIIEGHPVPSIPFVDVATGSLGQGLSVAAGMAYSSKYFDKIGNRVYCITGDGEVAEGSIWEAAGFASHYKLNNLTVFVDVNKLGQSQETMYAHETGVYAERFKAFGFHTIVVDGHSIRELVSALEEARKQTDLPTAVICRTEKGKNLGEKIEGKLNWHGKDLGAEFDATIALVKGRIKRQDIDFTTYPPEGDDVVLDSPKVAIVPNYKEGEKVSTRKAYGNGLLKARQSNPQVIGLDGDTKNSTFSITLFEKYPESFIECFIAEQNMVGVATGLSCRGKIAFCSTFAAFFIRAADQIRIAGLGHNKLKMAGSHSGCSIGEDGPSQMALEDLAFFRTLPNGVVLIPSDAVSTEKAVELVANYSEGPAFIRTARPDVSLLFKNDEPF